MLYYPDSNISPTFFSVAHLRAIEMEVVLGAIGDNDEGRSKWNWCPGLLLVEGRPGGFDKGFLRSVTAMNARPRHKQSQMMLLAGLSGEDVGAAKSEALGRGGCVDDVVLTEGSAVLVRGLSWEDVLEAFTAAGGLDRNPGEPVWHEALFVAKFWPFFDMEQTLKSAAAPRWHSAGPLRIVKGELAAGEESEMDNPGFGRRVCMAWGAGEGVRAALTAATDLGAEVRVLAGDSGQARCPVCGERAEEEYPCATVGKDGSSWEARTFICHRCAEAARARGEARIRIGAGARGPR